MFRPSTVGRTEFGVALLAILVWCATLAPLISVAAADVRVLAAFSTDEAAQVNMVRSALERRRFDVRFGNYGHLYYNVALVALRSVADPGRVSERQIAILLRGISTAAGAAALTLVFLWTRRTYGRTAAWVSLTVLVLNPLLYMMACTAHPDTLQLFLQMAALWLIAGLAERPTASRLIAASAAAGLVFACKYGGLPELAILWLAVAWTTWRKGAWVSPLNARWFPIALLVAAAALAAFSLRLDVGWVAAHLTDDGDIDLPNPESAIAIVRTALRLVALGFATVSLVFPLWRALERAARLRSVLTAWALTIVAFSLAFTAVSPASLRKLAVVKGLAYHVMREGGEHTATSAWASLMAEAMGAWVVVAAGAACALIVAMRRTRSFAATDAVLIGWSALYLIVLATPIHWVTLRYVLPLVPPMAMLAGRGLALAAGDLTARFRSAMAGWRTIAAVVAIVIVALEVPLARRVLAERAASLAREQTSDAIWVGRWLGCHTSPATRIAYDYLSYVPSQFHDAAPTWGGSPSWLERIDPDVVLVNRPTSESFQSLHSDQPSYYPCLAAGTCGFERVLARGLMSVYAKRDRIPDLFQFADDRAVTGCRPEKRDGPY